VLLSEDHVRLLHVRNGPQPSATRYSIYLIFTSPLEVDIDPICKQQCDQSQTETEAAATAEQVVHHCDAPRSQLSFTLRNRYQGASIKESIEPVEEEEERLKASSCELKKVRRTERWDEGLLLSLSLGFKY
jgi:hypothetical protein